MKCGYIKVNDDGSLGERLLSPDWRDDAGSKIIDDRIFIAHGYKPLFDDRPEHNPDLQRVKSLEREHWIVKSDRVEIAYAVIDKSPDEVFAESKAQIEAKAKSAIYCKTLAWTRPDTGQEILVDLRDAEDEAAIKDMLLLSETDSATQTFRDADNVEHELSPAEVKDLAKTVLKHVSAQRKKAWKDKGELRTILQSAVDEKEKARQLTQKAKAREA